MNPVDIRLYGIIDPELTGGRDPVGLVRSAVAGGCTAIQYRDRSSAARRFVETARILKSALAGTGVPLLIADRVDVALTAGADGVHLGQESMHPNDARKLLGQGAIVGLTVNTPEQADETVRMQIDFACVGGVFATTDISESGSTLGPEGLARIAFRARLAGGVPIGAAAGIDRSNAGAVIASGADGIAVASALFMAERPEQEARRLREIVDQALAVRRKEPASMAAAFAASD